MTMVRHCAHCDQEFEAHVLTCSDCGRPLPEPRPEGMAPPPPPPPHAAPVDTFEGEAAPLPGEFEPETAREAGRLLGEAGIALRMEVTPRAGVRIAVPAARFEAARALLEKADLMEPVDSADPVAVTGGPCPACGTHVRPGVTDCPDCGLSLGGDAPLVCSRCGTELDPPFGPCPKCAPE